MFYCSLCPLSFRTLIPAICPRLIAATERGCAAEMIGCDRGDDQTSQMILLLGVDGQEPLIEASLLNAGRNNLMWANYTRCTSREMYHEGKLTVVISGDEGGKLINFFVFRRKKNGTNNAHAFATGSPSFSAA